MHKETPFLKYFCSFYSDENDQHSLTEKSILGDEEICDSVLLDNASFLTVLEMKMMIVDTKDRDLKFYQLKQ